MDFSHLNSVSWYPGHMRIAEREMGERVKSVDLVIEVLDSRCAATSRNTNFDAILHQKTRVLVLGKQDLADPVVTQAWLAHYRRTGLVCLNIHHQQRNAVAKLVDALNLADQIDRKRRGATRPRLRALRAMVIGVPNVGKSSIINLALGKKKASVGPRPGVTRHQQWLALSPDVELLDTPGVMMPKVGGAEAGLKLGLINAIKDELIGHELLVQYILHVWEGLQVAPYYRHYGLHRMPNHSGDLLDLVGMEIGALRPGGEPDREQAAQRILQDLRLGKFGPISLDGLPPRAAAPEAASDDADDDTDVDSQAGEDRDASHDK